MKKKIKIGLDFDGVVAYNPFRVIRYPITYFKRNILGIKKLSFWFPQKKWQQIFWIILHESSVFPARGIDLFKEMVERGKIEAHLISARYSFLDDNLQKWLRRHNLYKYFESMNINKDNEQPHLFKEKIVEKLGVEYYIEDNWDIVNYLSQKSKVKSQKSGTKIFWIYNVMDRRISYKYRFPYLEKALKALGSDL